MDLGSYIKAQYPVLPADLKLAIRYSDESGNVTDRIIAPIKYFKARDGREFLRTWCYLRNAERTFRMDRILTARVLEGTATETPFTVNCSRGSYYEPARRVLTTGDSARATQSARAEIRSTGPRHPKRKRHPFLTAACVVVIGIVAYSFFSEEESGTYSTPSKIYGLVAKIRGEGARFAASSDRQTTATQVAAAATAGRASAAAAAVTAKTMYESGIAAKAASFIEVTGLADKDLISRYAAADLDRDGSLSWNEIRAFQNKLCYSNSYKANETALNPEEFFESGGGDCEDWSLATAGLLKF